MERRLPGRALILIAIVLLRKQTFLSNVVIVLVIVIVIEIKHLPTSPEFLSFAEVGQRLA